MTGRQQEENTLWQDWGRRLSCFIAGQLAVSAATRADLVQEVLLDALETLPGESRPEVLGPWLFRAARCRCIDWLRGNRAGRREATPTLYAEPPDSRFTADGPLLAAETRQQVRAALAALVPDDRLIAYLFWYEGLGCRVIGEIVEKPEGTVKYRLHEIRRILRRRLEAPDA